jgi:hypothetical protein
MKGRNPVLSFFVKDAAEDTSVVVVEADSSNYTLPDRNVDMCLLTWWEGNTSKPVVPSNNSGPTISMGLDLGTAGDKLITQSTKSCVDTSTLRTLLSARGLRGDEALAWTARNKVRLTDKQKMCIADNLVAEVLRSLHTGLDKGSIESRTAAVSFAMATGRPGLLDKFISNRDWIGMANFIESYHDNYPGSERTVFSRRRHNEAELIAIGITKPKLAIDPD